MESPLKSARVNLGLSAADLAAAAGTSCTSVSLAECGRSPIPTLVLAALSRAGLDTDSLQAEHRAYRNQRQEQILNRICGRTRGLEPVTREAMTCATKSLP